VETWEVSSEGERCKSLEEVSHSLVEDHRRNKDRRTLIEESGERGKRLRNVIERVLSSLERLSRLGRSQVLCMIVVRCTGEK